MRLDSKTFEIRNDADERIGMLLEVSTGRALEEQGRDGSKVELVIELDSNEHYQRWLREGEMLEALGL